MMRLYCMESGIAYVSRILGVSAIMLSLMFCFSSFTSLSESARAALRFMRCSASYFLRSFGERELYHASNFAFALAMESAM